MSIDIAEITSPSEIEVGDIVFAKFATRAYVAQVTNITTPSSNDDDANDGWHFDVTQVSVISKDGDEPVASMYRADDMTFAYNGDGTDELPQMVWVVS